MRLVACCVAGALLVASTAHADEPTTTHVEWQQDDDVAIAGIAAFASFYLLGNFVAWIGDAYCDGACKDRSYDWLYLPIAGPAIAAAMPGVYQLNPAWSVILVADTIVQATGAIVALVGHFVPTKRVVVKDKQAKTTFHVTPGASGANLGLTFSASF